MSDYASRLSSTTISDLPIEIIEKILLRFPARLLIRLTLVSKKWKSLILNPNFTRDHAIHASLDQSNLHNKLIMDWNIEDDWCFTEVYSSVIYSMTLQSIDYEYLKATKFELNFPTSRPPETLGSCNGLLLIGIDDVERRNCDTRLLWNPLFTKRYRLLPPCISASSHHTHLHGFGYVPSSDDYKVVTLNRRISKGDDNPVCYSELQVEVYSLKTDLWRIIVRGVPSTNIVCPSSRNYIAMAGTHVHGFIYWSIGDRDTGIIIAFDTVTEKFKLIETPCGNNRAYFGRLKLVDIRGYLGAFCRRSTVSEDVTVVWIWNEDENNKGFWTKLFKIPDEYDTVDQILLFMNNNEVLLQVTGPAWEGLYLFDSERTKFRAIPCASYTWTVHMVETLVSPFSS